jgi:hypothetical protein
MRTNEMSNEDQKQQTPPGCEASAFNELLSSAGLMHPSELQRIAIKLGNGLWCRHWYNWGRTTDPWIMAIQIRSASGSPVGCDDLKQHGFVRGDSCLYFIRRADEDGKPYMGSGR